jgi:uncharacterized protein YneF (UPF0154 family)|tara:strand:- start:135 stop:332 length:198 start_codon:yes stop_codon:yes gene_type:complete
MFSKIDKKNKSNPTIGISLMGFTIIICLVFLIYFGAWVAEKRLEVRDQKNPVWWENTVLWVCPLH